MKPRRVFCTAWVVVTATAGCLTAQGVPAWAQESAPATIPAPGRVHPLVNLQAPRAVPVEYAGAEGAVRSLRAGSTPTALAVGDFDADGAPDLATGYRAAHGGVVTLLRGNPEAFAPKDAKAFQAAMQGNIAPTFTGSATAYAVPESPDFLATGDFNRDGFVDLLVGTNGGNLYLLKGDGQGHLGSPQPVALPGSLEALDALRDGHVAVSIGGTGGPEVMILAPGPQGLHPVAAFATPAPAKSLAWGRLGGGADLAAGAGDSILLIYNALSPRPQTETVGLDFAVSALAVGDFIWDRDGRLEIAALGDDGRVRILEHGTLDTRPLTAADAPGRRAALWARMKQTQDAMALGPWTVAKTLAYAGPAAIPAGGFSSPHLAASRTSDLMVLNGGHSRLDILDTSGETANATASVSLSGAPVAAVALPRKINGARDLVALTAGSTAITVTEDLPDPTFNVTTTLDEDTAGACTSPYNTSGNGTDGQLSLREAVCEANNNGAATSVINLPEGTYSLTISAEGGVNLGSSSGELQIGSVTGENVTIVGANQSTTIIQQTDGVDRLIEQDPGLYGSIPLSIENVTLQNGDCTTGTDCTYGGGAILGLGSGSDDLTLTDVTLQDNENSQTSNGGALSAGGSGNLTITGSTFSGNTAPSGSLNGATGGGLYFSVNANSSNLTITNSTFTGNTADMGGGGAALLPADGDTVAITGSTFTGNSSTSNPGGAITTANAGGGTFSISNSRIVGNTDPAGGTGLYFIDAVSTMAINNWWGCNGGPNTSGCDSVVENSGGTDGSFTPSPWLVLGLSSGAAQVDPDASTGLTADLTHNNNGTGGFSVPDGTAVTWGATLGTISGASGTLTSGQGTATFNAGASTGTGSAQATVDNQTVTLTIDVGAAPSITSANNTVFPPGFSDTFTVTATGNPTPSLSETGGLPSGVTFVDNHNGTATLSGTPGVEESGTYSITITAQNGDAPNATQSFTLTVGQTPTITWSPATTIINGTSLANELNATASCGGGCGSFTYTATPTGETVTGSSILAAGSYTLTATFNPSSDLYTTNTATSPLTVSGESVWIVNSGGGTAELAGNGYGITSSADAGGSLAAAIDANGNVWTIGSGGTLLESVSQTGISQHSIASGGGLDAPAGIAIDGASQVWVTNSGNDTFSLFLDNGSAASSPAGGFTDSSISNPSGIAIDSGGSIWIANEGNSTITRILGAAAPAAPLSTAAKNNTTGARP